MRSVSASTTVGGKWYQWIGHWWELDKDELVYRKAIEAARERYTRAAEVRDLKQKDAAARWAIGSENRNRIEAALKLAQAQTVLATTGEEWDKDPMLLGVANGVVDLRNGNLRDGSRNDAITMHSAVPYNPGAECPRWKRFLGEIFAQNKELIDWLQRACGYSLTGLTYEQIVLLLWGTGWNGKSTFLRVLREVVGNYARNVAFSTLEASFKSNIPNDMAALAGKRLVTASEVKEGAKLDEARIKALAGEDVISARFLHGEWFEFRPTLKLWLAVNHKPRVATTAKAFGESYASYPSPNILRVGLIKSSNRFLEWSTRGYCAG